MKKYETLNTKKKNTNVENTNYIMYKIQKKKHLKFNLQDTKKIKLAYRMCPL